MENSRAGAAALGGPRCSDKKNDCCYHSAVVEVATTGADRCLCLCSVLFCLLSRHIARPQPFRVLHPHETFRGPTKYSIGLSRRDRSTDRLTRISWSESHGCQCYDGIQSGCIEMYRDADARMAMHDIFISTQVCIWYAYNLPSPMKRNK